MSGEVAGNSNANRRSGNGRPGNMSTISSKRIIRKLEPVGPQSFDEQLWPIYVSIVVLGAYLMGVVISVLHFNDPRFFANAATWLGIITLAVGFALWATGYVQSRFLRRTLMLSLLLSLIINVSLLVTMAWTSIFSTFWKQERPQALTKRPKPEIVIPEYPVMSQRQQQRVPQEHERPVETGEPTAEERIELTRQSTHAFPAAERGVALHLHHVGTDRHHPSHDA